MKEVTCPICKSTGNLLITDKLRFGRKGDVRRCNHCDLLFLDQGSFDLPPDFYESQYHQTYLTHVEPAALDPKLYYEKMLKSTRPWSERINRMLTGGETILDFGCSTGHLLKNIHGQAEKVYGHEVNTKEIKFCRTQLGLDVSNTDLGERFEEGMFDYITMIFVLEHIADPIELLTYLKKFLKPKGKIIVLVPNAADALLNFYDIPDFAEFYFCLEHLYYYTPTTIEIVFKESGLKGTIESIQEYPITNHLNWGYRQKPSDTLAARQLVPDIPLKDDRLTSRWENFWIQIDIDYKKFLAEIGFGDRLWCVVGIE